MPFRMSARRSLPAILWSLLAAVLLLAPGDELPDPGAWEWLDKPVHAALFAIQFALLVRPLAGSRPVARHLAIAALGSGLYALVLETAQLWVPGRAWEWWDLGAALVGIAVAALLVGRSRATLRATQ